MGEFDQVSQPKTAGPAARTSAAPGPKTRERPHIAELRRQLKHGAATVAWLRDSVLPNLATMHGGILASGGPETVSVARRGLATIEDVLDRTQDAGNGPLIQQAQAIPDELVAWRQRLQSDLETLTNRVEELTRPPGGIAPQVLTPPAIAPTKSEVPKYPSPPSSVPQPSRPLRPLTYTPHAAGPPKFDFGKSGPGTTHKLSLPIFNLVPHPASAVVRFDGSSAITLHATPTHLYAAGTALPEGAQHVELMFIAPTARGTHRGTVRVDLSWGHGIRPETLAIPVIAHSLLAGEQTDDERDVSVGSQREHQAKEHSRKQKSEEARRELVEFNKAHPGFTNAEFSSAYDKAKNAMDAVGKLHAAGIQRAADQIWLYRKAPPPTAKPEVWMDLAMLALDIASAGFANVVAKSIEGGLKAIAAGAARTRINPLTGKVASATKTFGLGESTIYAISDSVKEALKIGSKRSRTGGGSTPNNPGPNPDLRVEFLRIAAKQNILADKVRADGIVDSRDLLRPLVYRDPAAGVAAMQAIGDALNAELGSADELYYTSSMHRWFDFIAQLELDLHRVGSVTGRPIAPARGVVDIGFQAGTRPRDPVSVKSAIMRGVSNTAAHPLWSVPLLREDVPIRLYGLPSPNHAELLVTVTRNARGEVRFVDETNGSAPGPGNWLKLRGGGDPRAGAQSLLRDLVGTSLESQGLSVKTDQDPADEFPQ